MRGGGCAATKREGRTPFVALLTTLWGFWCWGGAVVAMRNRCCWVDCAGLCKVSLFYLASSAKRVCRSSCDRRGRMWLRPRPQWSSQICVRALARPRQAESFSLLSGHATSTRSSGSEPSE